MMITIALTALMAVLLAAVTTLIFAAKNAKVGYEDLAGFTEGALPRPPQSAPKRHFRRDLSDLRPAEAEALASVRAITAGRRPAPTLLSGAALSADPMGASSFKQWTRRTNLGSS